MAIMTINEQLKNEIKIGIDKGNIKTCTDLKATINAFYLYKYWNTNKIEYCKIQENLNSITEDIMKEMEITHIGVYRKEDI